MNIWKPIVLLLFLGGCSTAHQAAIQAGINSAKEASDAASSVLIQSTCGMTLGAFYRLDNPNHKAGATLICNPGADKPITREDLRNFLALP